MIKLEDLMADVERQSTKDSISMSKDKNKTGCCKCQKDNNRMLVVCVLIFVLIWLFSQLAYPLLVAVTRMSEQHFLELPNFLNASSWVLDNE